MKQMDEMSGKDQHWEGQSQNYELKSRAVEELVEAMHEDAPQYSQEELNQYRTKRGIQIPTWLKIVALKAWFAGAVCFFMIWGLSSYLADMLDLLVVVGVTMGMVTELLVNSVLRFMEKYPGQNDKWMLFPKKTKLGSFFLNIVYGIALVYCVYFVYANGNAAIAAALGDPELVALGVEPVLFGLLCMGFDLLFIGMKRMLQSILRDAKEKARSQTPN